MHYRVAVIGSLLIGIASFAFAQNDQIRTIDQTSLRPPSVNDTISAIVMGVVRSDDNRGISNARIEVRDANGMAVASTYSGPNGSFQINGLHAGRYEVVATIGLAEAREQLSLDHGQNSITLRVSERGPMSEAGDAHSVSVAEMRVPEKARKALIKARELIGKRREEDARKELAKALEIYPQYSEALRERGILQFASGHSEEAIADLEQAIKYDPNNGMAYIALGAALNNLEKYQDAARALDRGEALMPNAWQVHFELARTSLAKADFAASLRSLDRAKQLMKDEYAPVHLVRAHALMGLKNYKEAQSELEAFISANPNSADSALVQQTLNEVKTFTARAASGK